MKLSREKAMAAFAKRLRERRTELGLSRATVARDAEVSENTIERLESGECDPALTTICAVAYALGMRPAKLMPLQHGMDCYHFAGKQSKYHESKPDGKRFRELWADETLSTADIASALGITPTMTRIIANALGLIGFGEQRAARKPGGRKMGSGKPKLLKSPRQPKHLGAQRKADRLAAGRTLHQQAEIDGITRQAVASREKAS